VLQRTDGGVFVANLGSSSDDFREELRRIADEVDRLITAGEELDGQQPATVLLCAESRRISELFAPHNFRVTPFPGLLLWIIDAKSSELWLREPEPLLAAMRRAQTYRLNDGPISQAALFVIKWRPVATAGAIKSNLAPSFESPPGTLELARQLLDTGVPAFAVPQNLAFFVEVRRPDAVVGSVQKAPLPRSGTSSEKGGKVGAPSFVFRAPLLRRLTLAAIESPTECARLFEELLSRKIALLVMTDPQRRLRERSLPGFGKAVPVYPDLMSLLQAVDDLGLDRNSFPWARFLPRDLFTWVDQQRFGGLALNVYKDRRSPKYFLLNKEELSALARGCIPAERETVH